MKALKALYIFAATIISVSAAAQLPDIFDEDESEQKERNDWRRIYSINQFDYFILMDMGGGYMHALSPTDIGKPTDLLTGGRFNLGQITGGIELSFYEGEGLFANLRFNLSSFAPGKESEFNASLGDYLGDYTVVSTDLVIPSPTDDENDAPITASNTTFHLNLGYQITRGRYALAVQGGGHMTDYFHIESYSTVKLNNTNRYYFVDFQAENESSYGFGYQAGLRLLYKPWENFGFTLQGTYFRTFYNYDFYEYETDLFTYQETSYLHTYDDVVDWISISLGLFICI
ncbi:MAG: hypothetical protein HWD92_08800 [Flavobacteriia bacterium]|nr:hypothetical protein [Flavobacteriia bacterium]